MSSDDHPIVPDGAVGTKGDSSTTEFRLQTYNDDGSLSRPRSPLPHNESSSEQSSSYRTRSHSPLGDLSASAAGNAAYASSYAKGSRRTMNSSAFEYNSPYAASKSLANGSGPSSVRGSRPSPLSVPMSNGRNSSYSSRGGMQQERPQSNGVGISRSPYSQMSRFFVTVIPPAELNATGDADLSASPSAIRTPSSSAFASSSHLRRGTLMPLYPTLGAQLYAISREYSLPSIGGLQIYLCDDGEGNLGPRISEETWPFLWARYFDEQSESLYHDITSPAPAALASMPFPASFSPADFGADSRRHSGATSVARSQHETPGRRRTEEGPQHQFDQAGNVSIRRPYQSHSTQGGSSHGAAGSYSANGISPRQFATPSPFQRTRQDALYASSNPMSASPLGASRLPIVARIEWAVDKARAPWWNHFIGIESSGDLSIGSPYSSLRHNAKQRMRPGRRSLHLQQQPPSSRSRVDIPNMAAAASHNPTVTDGARDSRIEASRRSSSPRTDSDMLPASTRFSNSLDDAGYLPLGEEAESVADVEEDANASAEPISPSRRAAPTSYMAAPQTAEEDSHDGRSYAGYSTLMSVVNGAAAAHGGSSTGLDESSDRGEDEYAAGEAAPGHVPFNVHALDEGNDEAMWLDLRKSKGSSAIAALQDDNFGEHDRESSVHDWIAKTQTPPSKHDSLGRSTGRTSRTSRTSRSRQYDDEVQEELHYAEGEEEESLPDEEDDLTEVVGLWAERAVSSNGVPSLANVEEADVVSRKSVARATPDSVARSIKRSSASSSRYSQDQRQASEKRSSAASSRRSSKRSSKRTSRTHDVPVPSLTTSSSMTFGSASNGNQAMQTITTDSLQQPQSSSSIGKLSLLSPIALQDSSATFSGPAPNLGDILASESDDIAQAPRDYRPNVPRQDSVTLETPTISSPAMLSPTRLEPPILRSPGQMSGSSSTSEFSDTLMDMERALQLLSPAAFNGHSPSSAVGSKSGLSTEFGKRARIRSNISASESMARARTLSASVSPSLHLFRTSYPNSGMGDSPALPNVTSPSDTGKSSSTQQGQHSPATIAELETSRGSAIAEDVKLQSRPISMAAAVLDGSAKGPSLAEEVTTQDAFTYNDEQSAVQPSSPTTQHSREMIDSSKQPEEHSIGDGNMKIVSSIEDPSQKALQVARNTIDEPEYDFYEPDTKDYAMRDQWIAAQQSQLPLSPPTNENDLETQGAETSTKANEVPQEVRSEQIEHKPRYVTVGVQAECESSSRDSSQFSLTSDDDTSEMEENDPDEEEDGDLHEIANADVSIDTDEHDSSEVELIDSRSAGSPESSASASNRVSTSINETPRALSVATFDGPPLTGADDYKFETSGGAIETDLNGGNLPVRKDAAIGEVVEAATDTLPSAEASDDPAPLADEDVDRDLGESQDLHASAFAKFIQGHLLSDSVSEVHSSQVPSPHLTTDVQTDEQHEGGHLWGATSGSDDVVERSDAKEVGLPDAHEGHADVEEAVRADSELKPEPEATAIHGSTSPNRNSIMSVDQWSQDGSAFEMGNRSMDSVEADDDDDDDDEDDEDEAISVARHSHISGFSSHRETLDNTVGGRTPTFLYDQDLLDDDAPDGMASNVGPYSGAPLLSPASAGSGRSGSRAVSVPGPTSSGAELQVPQQSIVKSGRGEGEDEHRFVDALGIGLPSPTARNPLPSPSDMLARNGIVSLAGEPMDDDDLELHMPLGFEQVHVVQSPTRSVASTMLSSHSATTDSQAPHVRSALMTATTTVEGPTEGMTRIAPTTLSKQDSILSRRSMGSISDHRHGKRSPSSASSLDAARRASASATSVGGTTATPSEATARSNGFIASGPPPHRRASPRLMARDGVALPPPIRRSMSPHSPRHRFGALPPSPSLQTGLALAKGGASYPHSETNGFRNGSPPELGNGNLSSQSSPNFASPSLYGSPAHHGANTMLRSPAPRRIGSPLIIDTNRAQEEYGKAVYAARAQQPMYQQQPHVPQPQPSPVFRGAAAATVQPPSPRGPRAPPFASPVAANGFA